MAVIPLGYRTLGQVVTCLFVQVSTHRHLHPQLWSGTFFKKDNVSITEANVYDEGDSGFKGAVPLNLIRPTDDNLTKKWQGLKKKFKYKNDKGHIAFQSSTATGIRVAL